MKKETKELTWFKYPQEKPNTPHGWYLCRGKGGLVNKVFYYVCLWVNEKDNNIERGFYYDGNILRTKDGTLEYIDIKDLE